MPGNHELWLNPSEAGAATGGGGVGWGGGGLGRLGGVGLGGVGGVVGAGLLSGTIPAFCGQSSHEVSLLSWPV